jgi:hypothetical protein
MSRSRQRVCLHPIHGAPGRANAEPGECRGNSAEVLTERTSKCHDRVSGFAFKMD